MKKNFRVLGVALVLMLVVFVAVGFAEEAKKYPPYPDVWGYDLSGIHQRVHKDGSPNGMVILKTETGDYIIAFSTQYEKYKKKDGIYSYRKYEYGMFLFFSSNGKPLVENIAKNSPNDPFTTTKLSKKFARVKKLILSDGSTIENDYAGSPKGGYGTFINTLIKKDKAGKVIATKYLLYLREKPIRVEVDKYAEMAPKKGYVNETVYNGYVTFVPLKDGTFLVYDSKGTFVVRLDENFNTKSELLNKKIFLLDRSDYDKIFNNMPSNWDYQTVNNETEKYLRSKLKK